MLALGVKLFSTDFTQWSLFNDWYKKKNQLFFELFCQFLIDILKIKINYSI